MPLPSSHSSSHGYSRISTTPQPAGSEPSHFSAVRKPGGASLSSSSSSGPKASSDLLGATSPCPPLTGAELAALFMQNQSRSASPAGTAISPSSSLSGRRPREPASSGGGNGQHFPFDDTFGWLHEPLFDVDDLEHKPKRPRHQEQPSEEEDEDEEEGDEDEMEEDEDDEGEGEEEAAQAQHSEDSFELLKGDDFDKADFPVPVIEVGAEDGFLWDAAVEGSAHALLT